VFRNLTIVGIVILMGGCATSPPQPSEPVWVDATGASLGLQGALMHIEDGLNWPIDPETGQVYADLTLHTVYYSEEQCQGVVYVSAGNTEPRIPFVVAGDAYYVRPDDLQSLSAQVASMLSWGGCTDRREEQDDVLRLSTLQHRPGLTPPRLPWVGPLHRELR